MDRSDSPFIELVIHPGTASRGVRRAAARAEWVDPGVLRLGYRLEGELGEVRIPAPAGNAGRADRLWAHTCFEAFVGLDDSPHYLELNFSPSGEWAAYRFESYRSGMAPAALAEPPRLTVRPGAGRLELEAEVRSRGALGGVSAESGKGRLRIGLSTVVEDREGGLSYWALRHPAGRPDFHHPDSFSLALAFPPESP